MAEARLRADKRLTRKKKVSNPLTREVVLFFVGAFGIYTYICIFAGDAGAWGDQLRTVLIGLFGFGACLMPFIITILALYALLSRKKNGKKKVFTGALAFLCLIALIHVNIINEEIYASVTADQYYEAGSILTGGMIGAMIGDVAYATAGKVGAVIFFVAGLLACGVLLTGHSLSAAALWAFDGVREFLSGFLLRYDYEEDLEMPSEPPAPPAPPRPEPKRKEIPAPRKPLFYAGRDKNKILLVHEEIQERARRVSSSPAQVSGNPQEALISISPPDRGLIKVRGLVEKMNLDSAAQSQPKVIQPIRVLPPPEQKPDPDEDIFEKTDAGLDDDYQNDEDEAPRAARRLWQPAASGDSEPPKRSMTLPENSNEAELYRDYIFPPIELLKINYNVSTTESRSQILDNSHKLENTLRSFKVEAKVVEVSVGPTVTRYELAPGQGVKVSAIANLSNDLALSLAAQGIRIEAPIPGKSAVGIEIPNREMQSVFLREIFEDEAFENNTSKLAFAVGKDIAGKTIVADISKMPHLLIAGATGAGKSVCINTLIAGILYKAKPNEVKLIMIDPKVVELSVYNGIPHLLIPVVTDPKKAAGALNWAVMEMDIRYNLFAEANVRDLKSYNALMAEHAESEVLPQLVVIIDELADLMMTAKGEIEEAICRLAQKARAAGLHLIIATQRPSVDVITGLIKANVPSRMAFAVSSGTDSRTVLDMTGAEKLLGKGDMLFLPVGLNKPVRIQCGFISDKEVESIVEFLLEQQPVRYDPAMVEKVTDPGKIPEPDGDLDEFFDEAVEFLITKGKASASMLQRQFRIGYNRASRLIEVLEERGIVGHEVGSKPRTVLIKMSEWEKMRS